MEQHEYGKTPVWGAICWEIQSSQAGEGRGVRGKALWCVFVLVCVCVFLCVSVYVLVCQCDELV